LTFSMKQPQQLFQSHTFDQLRVRVRIPCVHSFDAVVIPWIWRHFQRQSAIPMRNGQDTYPHRLPHQLPRHYLFNSLVIAAAGRGCGCRSWAGPAHEINIIAAIISVGRWLRVLGNLFCSFGRAWRLQPDTEVLAAFSNEIFKISLPWAASEWLAGRVDSNSKINVVEAEDSSKSLQHFATAGESPNRESLLRDSAWSRHRHRHAHEHRT
jgi:hypothetical protein